MTLLSALEYKMAKDILSDKYLEMFRSLANLVDKVDTYHQGLNENELADDIDKVNANNPIKKG